MYFLELSTDINMGSEEFIKNLLNDWYHHENKLLRPEYYGMGEPIRYSIAERGLDAAVNAWMKNKMPVMLRRKIKPKFTVDMEWRPRRGLDPRVFPWECRIRLAFNALDHNAISMLKFIVEKLNPAFAYLTNEDDLKAKHYIQYKEKGMSISSYIGREPGGKTLPGDVSSMIPGVYWVTFFSKWAIGIIGRSKFKDLKVHSLEKFNNGYLVTLYKESKEILSENARKIEADTIDKLGRNLFFDKSKLTPEDIKSLLLT